MKRTRICLSVISVNKGIVLHRETKEIALIFKPLVDYRKRYNEFMAKDFTNQGGNRISMTPGLITFETGLTSAIKEFKKLKRI